MAAKKAPLLKRFKGMTPDECNVLSEALIAYPNILADDEFYERDEKVEMTRIATKLLHEIGRSNS